MKTNRLSHIARIACVIAGLWLAAPCMAANAPATTPVSAAAMMDTLMAEREALFDSRGIDVPQLSQDIATATRESMQLGNQGKIQEALDRLLQLEKYTPLPQIPSATVQLIASAAYTKLGKADLAKQYTDRGTAYAKLLQQRIGTGDSPGNPLRIVLISEANDWVQIHNAQIAGTVRSMVSQSHKLTVLSYLGPTTNGQPRDLYIEIDPRTQAQMDKGVDRYLVVPLSSMRPEHKEMLKLAHDKRERFLNDTNFPFMELQGSVSMLTKAAAALDQAGKPQEALAKLREIERMRPIEEIPTVTLLSMYSYLVGKTGDTKKQTELRGLIFGVQQDIAHSGDGKSPATALHVIMTDEEYDWLSAKKLKTLQQHAQDEHGEKYDVMDVQDAQGAKSQVYFDITRFYAKYMQGMGGAGAH